MIPAQRRGSELSLGHGSLRLRAWHLFRTTSWRGLLCVCLTVLAAYTATLAVAVWWQGTRDERRPAEAILVLGAAQWNGEPSPVLRARLDHAILLYRQGYAPRMVVTGGVGAGDTISEAAVSAAYLGEQGIPELAILVEDQGRSSLESIRAAGTILSRLGVSRVLLVSDPPHMLRALRLAQAVGLEAYGSPAAASPVAANPTAQARFLLRELLIFQTYQWIWVTAQPRPESLRSSTSPAGATPAAW
jgi:uncharacterized SAM-binding protein YcdF (DUF218 family)